MTGPVNVNTVDMLQTAQKSADSADNIIGQARQMLTKIDFVLANWKGEAGSTFRMVMEQQRLRLDGLIEALKKMSDAIKLGGQGFASHDASGHSKTMAAGQQFLNGPLNR